MWTREPSKTRTEEGKTRYWDSSKRTERWYLKRMQRVHLHNSNSLLQEEREKGREGEREREKSLGQWRFAFGCPVSDSRRFMRPRRRRRRQRRRRRRRWCSLLLHLLPFLPSMPILSNREFQATKTANRRIITYKKSSRNSIKRNSTASKKLYRLT